MACMLDGRIGVVSEANRMSRLVLSGADGRRLKIEGQGDNISLQRCKSPYREDEIFRA